MKRKFCQSCLGIRDFDSKVEGDKQLRVIFFVLGIAFFAFRTTMNPLVTGIILIVAVWRLKKIYKETFSCKTCASMDYCEISDPVAIEMLKRV